jgi:hypothetical protein
VIDRDHDHIAPLGQIPAVLRGQFEARTTEEAAAMNPEQNRAAATSVDGRRPYIEVEAILVLAS